MFPDQSCFVHPAPRTPKMDVNGMNDVTHLEGLNSTCLADGAKLGYSNQCSAQDRCVWVDSLDASHGNSSRPSLVSS